MEQEIYTREELANTAGVSEERIESLEEEGLFSPSGLTAGEVPFYRQEKLVEITKVLQLLDMGYGSTEVRKIVEKVGVPGTRRGRGTRGHYLTVGELAEKAGVGARTIKHWEEKGIIAPSTRSEGGFRLYQKDYVYIVQSIKDLQLFGYRLEDIKEVVDLFSLLTSIKEGSSGLQGEEVLEGLARMTEKIKELKSHTRQLKDGIRRWDRLLDERRKDIGRVKEKVRRTLHEKKRKDHKIEMAGKSPSGSRTRHPMKPVEEGESWGYASGWECILNSYLGIFLKEEETEMKNGKNIFREFILPFVIAQVLTGGCCAGWVYHWVNM